ncbi:MAG: heavy-metal-associated domain-containing protein [Eubacteriales bacterium]|nr:heavy-metal-associated domain-containing protein [Eubacteriales bacterium]
MVDKTYHVMGMGCASCVTHVKSAVKDLKGVDICDVDLESEEMNVRFDENMLGFNDIKKAVEDAGYGLK